MAKKSNVSAFVVAQGQAQPCAKSSGGSVNTHLAKVDDWKKLAVKIEATYPDLQPNLQAVVNAGLASTGLPVMLAAYKAEKNPAAGLPSRNVIVYSSGTVVWTNLAPVA